MKKAIILFALLFSTVLVSAQKHVRVVRADSITSNLLTLSLQKTDISVQSSKKKKDKNKYYIGISAFQDTIRLVQELLDLEGDKRLLCIPLIGHSSISSSLRSSDTNVSIQVYALFLIWGLFNDYTYSAKYPVLRGEGSGKGGEESVSGEIVERAYAAYKKWFEESEGDIDRLRNTSPFDSKSGVSWLM